MKENYDLKVQKYPSVVIDTIFFKSDPLNLITILYSRILIKKKISDKTNNWYKMIKNPMIDYE